MGTGLQCRPLVSGDGRPHQPRDGHAASAVAGDGSGPNRSRYRAWGLLRSTRRTPLSCRCGGGCPAGAAVIESLLQQRRRTAALAYAPQVPGRAWTASKQVLQPNSELTASSPAGRGAQTRTGDLLLPKQALPTFVVRIGFLEFAWTTCFAIPAPDQHLLQRSGAVPEAIRSCPRQPAPIQPYHSS